jgi:checkpoint serine/threonine-protein kinase
MPVSDLVLVEFGRAIDLHGPVTNNVAVHDGQGSWMDAVYTGDAPTEQMQCVAMRLGLPWSFDVDTFGICASMYFLLFGTHMDIEKCQSASGNKRWMPTKQFPRHFEKKLWTDIYGSLLNLDEDFGRAIGSRPYSVKRLRNRIEDYLSIDGNDARLRDALYHQNSIVPRMRS